MAGNSMLQHPHTPLPALLPPEMSPVPRSVGCLPGMLTRLGQRPPCPTVAWVLPPAPVPA